MLSRLLILLLAVLVPCGAAAAGADRQAVTVHVAISTDTAGLSSGDLQVTRGLPHALVPLVRYALYHSGWLLTLDRAGTGHAARLDLTVRGRLVDQPVLTRQDQRRFFTVVDRYLKVQLDYTWRRGDETRTGQIEQIGRIDWLRLDNPNSINVRFAPQRAEPAIFTLQRLVGQWYEHTLGGEEATFKAEAALDSLATGRINFALTGDDPRGELVRLASSSLIDNFGVALTYDTGDVVSRLVARLELRPPQPDYALGLNFDELGAAYPGADSITVAQHPLVHPDLEFWRPYYSRLTLVHELAHALGAIHVSDESSLMNHGLQRLTDDRFDPLNRAIMEAALRGDFDPDDAIGYVQTLSRLLQSSSYRRADYPPIFSVYLSAAERDGDRKKIEAAIARRSFIVAGDAYTALEQADYHEAARLFRLAIKEDPQQATLWYYLGQCTRGAESFDAMEQAARLGYFLAQLMFRN